MKKIRVLVVDDSAFMRAIISRLLGSCNDIEVVGTARDGVDGLDKAQALEPDVITLDIEMPRMDGLQMLTKLMASYPRPVIMVSSIARPHAEATIKAFRLGAVDVVTKPSGQISLDMHVVRDELIRKVRAASTIRQTHLVTSQPPIKQPERTLSIPSSKLSQVIVIASSTGGPGALGRLLPCLPGDIRGGIVVVQHMPPGFTHSLARHLNEDSEMTVIEAGQGDRLVDGLCLIAPGGKHIVFDHNMKASLISSPPRHGVRPAVDVTLEALPDAWARSAIVVILTGMGMDGAAGARRIHALGGHVIAQDEQTSVVYGMPRAVAEMGIAHDVVPLSQAADAITTKVARGRRMTI